MSKLKDKIVKSRLFALINKLYHDTRIRFLFVGGLNTVIGLVVDTVVCLIFQKFTSVSANIYLVIGSVSGTILGAINSYFWNKYFTFQSKKKSFGEVIRFAIVYTVCFLFSYFCQLACLKIFGYEEESIYFYIAKVCILVVQVFLSWFGQRYFCFKKEKSEPENTENVQKTDVRIPEIATEEVENLQSSDSGNVEENTEN